MLKKSLRKLADFQQKYPVLVILIVLTITSFFAYYAVRIEKDANLDVMQRDDSQSMILQRLVDSEFGGTDTLFVLASIDPNINDVKRTQDIRDPQVIKAMMSLKSSLESETFVVSATSLGDLLYMAYGKLPETLEESKSMIDNLPKDIKELYLGRLLSKDYKLLNMIVTVSVEDTPGSLAKIEENVNEKIGQTPFPIGVTADLTGLPVLLNMIMNYLIGDNMRTILLAIAMVIMVLWVYFRSIRIAIMSSVPTLLTLTWLSGIMYLMDIRITVMTASIGAMMVGISVDYAIHLTHRFHSNVKEGKENATKDTVVGIGTALFASVATTVVGFLAMLLGISPNSQVQGTVLSIGVTIAFIVSIVILPAMMVVQRKVIYSRLDETLFRIKGRIETAKKSIIDLFLENIARFQVNKPWLVLGMAGVATILIIPGFSLVYLDTDSENWMPNEDPIIDSLNNVGNNFGGIDSMNLLFMLDKKDDQEYDPNGVKDLRDPRVLLPMSSLDKLVAELKWVDSVNSPSMSIKGFNNGRVPREAETIKQIIEDNPDIKGSFNKDYSIARFTPMFESITREEYYELMRELDGVSFPKEVSIVPQGSIPEDIEFEATMGADTMKTAGIGFLLVIIVASLFYGSIISGLLAFIPIVFAIIWTIGIMGYINLPFTVLTTGMLAILMGMGIDFSIHIIHSIKEGMKEFNNNVDKAIPFALMSTGQAISITTITTVLGFMALSFATLVNTMRLGWTLALGIFATFFACIVIVPSVIAIKYKSEIKKGKLKQD